MTFNPNEQRDERGRWSRGATRVLDAVQHHNIAKRAAIGASIHLGVAAVIGAAVGDGLRLLEKNVISKLPNIATHKQAEKPQAKTATHKAAAERHKKLANPHGTVQQQMAKLYPTSSSKQSKSSKVLQRKK